MHFTKCFIVTIDILLTSSILSLPFHEVFQTSLVKIARNINKLHSSYIHAHAPVHQQHLCISGVYHVKLIFKFIPPPIPPKRLIFLFHIFKIFIPELLKNATFFNQSNFCAQLTSPPVSESPQANRLQKQINHCQKGCNTHYFPDLLPLLQRLQRSRSYPSQPYQHIYELFILQSFFPNPSNKFIKLRLLNHGNLVFHCLNHRFRGARLCEVPAGSFRSILSFSIKLTALAVSESLFCSS